MDFDQMKIERDAILRRDILRTADSAKVLDGIGARQLMRAMFTSGAGAPDDDRHLTGLCVDLINAELLTRDDMRGRDTERRTLDNTRYAITDEGTSVLAGAIRHPLVYDDRLPQG